VHLKQIWPNGSSENGLGERKSGLLFLTGLDIQVQPADISPGSVHDRYRWLVEDQPAPLLLGAAVARGRGLQGRPARKSPFQDAHFRHDETDVSFF